MQSGGLLDSKHDAAQTQGALNVTKNAFDSVLLRWVLQALCAGSHTINLSHAMTALHEQRKPDASLGLRCSYIRLCSLPSMIANRWRCSLSFPLARLSAPYQQHRDIVNIRTRGACMD